MKCRNIDENYTEDFLINGYQMIREMNIWKRRIILLIVIPLVIAGVSNLSRGADEGAVQPGSDDMPGRVDLRPAFKKWGLSERQQGGRGTCSVFAVVGAMEYAVACQQDKGLRLSVEYLNWASNEVVGKKQDGGFFSDLWKGYEAYGICGEQAMEYQKKFDPELVPDEAAKEQARQLSEENELRIHWIKQWDPKTGLTDEELAEVKKVLSRGRPVCGGCRWPKKVKWKEKVLNMPGPDGVFDGHSILLVGYEDDPDMPGGGVFMIRNSNTKGSGYKMSYAYAAAYMNDGIWIE